MGLGKENSHPLCAFKNGIALTMNNKTNIQTCAEVHENILSDSVSQSKSAVPYQILIPRPAVTLWLSIGIFKHVFEDGHTGFISDLV